MKIFFMLMVFCLVANTVIVGQIPNKISYQGLFTTSSGIPVPDGSYDLKFEIYNLPSGGVLRHSETHDGVLFSKGAFSLVLGPLPAIFNESLYVEVTALAGPEITSPMTFSPRSELTSAPYSMHTQLADTARYAQAPWLQNGSNIYFSSGDVGIGKTTPGYKLDVNGILNATDIYKNGSPLSAGQWTTSGSDIYFNSGKVGIGTTSIPARLAVSVDGLAPYNYNPNASLLLVRGGYHSIIMERRGMHTSALFCGDNAFGLADDGRPIQFRTGIDVNGDPSATGNLRMIINTDGNVGIGTASPAYKLDVNGTVNATNYYNNGSPLSTSQWATSGSDIYYNSGNVGIGTTLPTHKLTVNGGICASSADPGIILRYDGGSQRDLALNWDAVNDRGSIYSAEPGSGYKPISFTATSFFFQEGDVGIGTTSPLHKLHVSGDINVDQGNYYRVGNEALLGMDDELNYRVGSTHALSMRLYAGSDVPRLFVENTTGNVGIGTTTPDANAKLDVNGYAFAKAPVVVYDSASGSGTSFDIEWLNDVRVDNNIVEKQANNYEFMLKKVGWYRISYCMYLAGLDINGGAYDIFVRENGSDIKLGSVFWGNNQQYGQVNGGIVIYSDGDDLASIFTQVEGVDTYSVLTSGRLLSQISIEYLGAD